MDIVSDKINCVWQGAKAGRILGGNAVGKVLMCSTHAVYLEFNNELVMLCDSERGHVSFALEFENFEKAFPKNRDIEGTKAVCSGNTLSFCGKSILLPDVEPEFVRTAAPLKALIQKEKEVVSLVIRTDRGFIPMLLPFRKELTLGMTPSGIEELNNIYATRAAKNMAGLFSALRNDNMMEVSLAFLKMLGLGPGLTPSTDDWCVGLLYTLRAYAPDNLAEICNCLNKKGKEYTNCISCAYLENACSGGEFEMLEDLLNTGTIEEAERLITVGCSSGSDILCGYLFGLSYLKTMI